ncbi:MAG TPA: glycerol-3-phosphate dehydrogenase/oxidase [Bdellovibrionales bacterium]|nr:hypothetical protein [Pseudobdellovibrionaceae bacterium]HAG90646.1 glycerol-3-phosphate dehydrogenase/oxidase [Bdellovibrionales bacterium]|tara:strand:- start:359 stop:2008 length:1650 start_codon:yes stop_codon:yes gene_type:complete
MSNLSALSRSQNLKTLKSKNFDLLIVGGGITGAGVARDAASRGMNVGLVEANDFASGTSSRSSKLVHGGIRYLEQYEFGLVFEALSERQRLFELAPNLVHPLKFAIPLYESGRVKPQLLKLGMMAYDFLSMYDAPELHQSFSTKELLQEYPLLQDKELMGGFTYYDAYMDDDRLVHETLRSAADHGATIANFVSANGPVSEANQIVGLNCTDHLSGEQFSISARHVVSCVGPWTDLLGQALLPKWQEIMRPSKGVHLVFERGRLHLEDAVVMAAEKRIVFAIPRNEMTIVGTTDTDFSKDPGEVRTQREDVDYLLKVAQRYFPGANLTESDIVSSYAGVRPLVWDGSASESATSREHVILHNPLGVSFVAGGKYTTYRHMAEQAVEGVLNLWEFEDQVRYQHSKTLEPLNPLCSSSLYERSKSEALEWVANGRTALQEREVLRLAERHGMEFEHILESYEGLLDRNLSSEEKLWDLELRHAVETTMCLNLKDFYFRRVPLFLARKGHGLEFIEGLSQTMGQILGWSESERASQVNALQKQISYELSWRD